MPEHKLLLIDDDQTLLELFGDHAEQSGYKVQRALNGKEGLRQLREYIPDLVVLDVMMPGMDGWTVCEKIRQTSSLPIILLTAKNEEVDKLRGFRLGVDDYVTKPFSFAELIARIGAVLTRARGPAPATNQLTSGELTIDLDQHLVISRGETVDLTPTEYRLLEILARHPQRAVPHETLLVDVWGLEYATETEHVKRYIWSLRKKIEPDPGSPKHIHTVRGFGYRFE